MIEQACAELHLNPSSSLMVGDKVSDMEAGQAAGVGQLFRVVSPAMKRVVSPAMKRDASNSGAAKEGVVLVNGLPAVARIVA